MFIWLGEELVPKKSYIYIYVCMYVCIYIYITCLTWFLFPPAPNSSYSFQVRGNTSAGYGDFSVPKEFSTDEDGM